MRNNRCILIANSPQPKPQPVTHAFSSLGVARLREEKLQKSATEHAVSWRQLLDHNSPVVAHTKLKASTNDLDQQSNCSICLIFA